MDRRTVETEADIAGRGLFDFFKGSKMDQHEVPFIIRNPITGLVLDAAEEYVKVQHYDAGSESQLWRLVCTEFGRFFIVSTFNGDHLNIAGGRKSRNKLITYPKTEGQIYENETWHIAGDGTIRTPGPGVLVLDLPMPRTAGTIVIADKRHGAENQIFQIEYL